MSKIFKTIIVKNIYSLKICLIKYSEAYVFYIVVLLSSTELLLGNPYILEIRHYLCLILRT